MKPTRNPRPRRPRATSVQPRERRVVVELEELRARLQEAEETLGAIRGGEVDALVVAGPKGQQVYTLQGAETPYRVLVEQMQEGALSISSDGTVLYSNRCFTDMVRLPMERVLGSSLSEHVPAENCASLADLLREARHRPVRQELPFRRGDGELADALVAASALPDDDAGRICLIVTDLTEHKRNLALLARRTEELQRSAEALRMAERLASVGTLATGIGHDMGNMLLPLRMRIDAMEAKGLPAEAHLDLEAVRQCAEHLARMANGLRLLALDPLADGREEVLDLAEWWPDAELVMRNALPHHIALEADLPAGTPPVYLARHALTQAVFNLVQNAGDVMQQQHTGRVRVWARGGEGGAVLIGVSDDGPGMTEEVRRHCLEPFFTTKTRRLSTGLGLSLVHGIVQRAGGSIRIESEPGRGTTFVLSLPAVPRREEDEGAERPLALVTIADERLRSYATSLLRSMGFEVAGDLASVDGQGALWVADGEAARRGEIDRFVAAASSRRAVLIGGNGVAKRSSRVVRVEGTAGASGLRQAIQDAAKRCLDGARS